MPQHSAASSVLWSMIHPHTVVVVLFSDFIIYAVRYILGIDIDEDALDICSNNLTEFELTNIDLLQMDTLTIPPSLHKSFDIAVMNPPFGTKHNKGLLAACVSSGKLQNRPQIQDIWLLQTLARYIIVSDSWDRELVALRYQTPPSLWVEERL